MERISKLFALAESPNEAEASSALAKATKLLADSGLSKSDLTSLGNAADKILVNGITLGKQAPRWAEMLIIGVAKLQGVTVVWGRRIDMEKSMEQRKACFSWRVCFVGKESNIAVTKTSISYLIEAIDRVGRTAEVKGAKAKEAFRQGAVSRVLRRMENMLLGDENCKALVVQDEDERKKAIQDMFGEMKSETLKPSGDILSYMRGSVAGNGISLVPQVKEEPRPAYTQVE